MNVKANRVAVATTSQLAADAAAEIDDLGGNAVDCAIAAAMCSINTQPGVCALAGSAFISVWAPGEDAVTIDGNVAVPGMGLPDDVEPLPETVHLEYGGGVETMVGASSVAVPGTLAAVYLASQKYGRLDWQQILGPSIRATTEGFPLSRACHYYLGYAGDVIYGRSADGHGALHEEDGSVRDAGSTITIPHLADSLAAIADEGPRVFYEGEIGRRIAEHVREKGGLLTLEDLRGYEPGIRKSLVVSEGGDWTIATNPPPAIGGAALVAMLTSFGTDTFDHWDETALLRLVRAQQATFCYRRQNLDLAKDVAKPVDVLLELARSGDLLCRYASGSTVHTSAVDSGELACAITASSGYGSGEMPEETGLWLNNCLGELELNLYGLDAGPPGERLPSNMAPSIARNSGRVLAMGTPGADRITTALHQFLVNFIQRGETLHDAVIHPRLHVHFEDSGPELAIEPGLDIPEIDLPVEHFPEISMYFGGVAAALYDSGSGFEVAADPRREGGTYISSDCRA